MGKIFDALQKSGKKNERASIKPLPKNQNGLTKEKMENVVPFHASSIKPTATRMDDTLVVYHEPQSIETELFKMLRTNLLFPSTGSAPRSILITSALPGEGKSFVSANLAISIAQGVEEHVLLIDGDVRRPTLHTRFGFKSTEGLCEYLTSGDNVADAFLKTAVDKLTLLPAGGPTPKPTELMASKKMKELLKEVKSRYDDRYIIIDSPPPSMAAETNAITQYVDAVILVVQASKTPQAAVQDVIELVGREKLIGVVLNQADESNRRYYGYGKSYY